MTRSYPDPLALSRSVLRTLIVLNLIVGVLILGLLVTSVVVGDSVMRTLPPGRRRPTRRCSWACAWSRRSASPGFRWCTSS